MSSKLALILTVFIVPLAGCANGNGPIGSGDTFLGEAVKYNAAVQTINPDPVYAPDAAKPGDSAVKGAAAVERYRTDKVKEVEKVMTSTEANGSNNSSSPR